MLFTRFQMCPNALQSFLLTFDSSPLQSQIWSGYHVIQYSNTACQVTRHRILPCFRGFYPRQPSDTSFIINGQKQAFLGRLFIKPILDVLIHPGHITLQMSEEYCPMASASTKTEGIFKVFSY